MTWLKKNDLRVPTTSHKVDTDCMMTNLMMTINNS